MKFKDYYAALGVPRDADTEAIRKAYRKLARKYHPDVSSEPQAEARFKEVAEAYECLKDTDKRAAYDQLGQRRGGDEFAPPPGWPDGFDATAFEGAGLADLLDAIARGRGGTRRGKPGPVHGADYEAVARITLEQAHRGTTLELDVGRDDGTSTLAVTILPGMVEGRVLRLRGRGGAGRHGGGAGDIYLRIELVPHPRFRAQGHDLYFDLALAPWEAALGAEVEVPGLEGPLLVGVPAGTSTGRRLRLRGHGLATGHGTRGDLYAVARIDGPASLTERERELFEALKQASAFNPRRTAAKEKEDASAG